MGNFGKSLIEGLLIAGLIWFLTVSYSWIEINGIRDTNSIIALATIIYAVFTFFMFWNMKSSSETQVRPLLITNFDDKLNLHLSNKIEKNQAKDVKIRVKVALIKKFKEDTNFIRFLHKYIFGREWNLIQDYFGSYKENYEIFNGTTKIDLSEYIASKIPLVKNKDNVVFKLLISISYDSLLDINYSLKEKYILRINDKKVKIDKIVL